MTQGIYRKADKFAEVNEQIIDRLNCLYDMLWAQWRSFMQNLMELLSIEFNCKPDDFLKSKNILTVSELHEGRRVYSSEKYFFHMVTMGGNTKSFAY